MNAITLVLVLILHSGGEMRLAYDNAFSTAESCTAYAMESGVKFAAREEVKQVKYYCIKTAEEI